MESTTEAGTLRQGIRLPWEYQRKRFVGRCIGALRVFTGQSASIPKGKHSTAIGEVNISDYYGGCVFSIGKPNKRDLDILQKFGRDLYWNSKVYDGSGASMCSD